MPVTLHLLADFHPSGNARRLLNVLENNAATRADQNRLCVARRWTVAGPVRAACRPRGRPGAAPHGLPSTVSLARAAPSLAAGDGVSVGDLA
ncbi:MAG: hypothetical protein QM811_24015 [Pirellulales bacterium]